MNLRLSLLGEPLLVEVFSISVKIYMQELGVAMYPNWILQRAQLTPARRALSFEEQSWTFEELKIYQLNEQHN